MRQVSRGLLWLSVGLVVLAAPAQAADPVQLCPDDTEVVLRLNVRQLLEASLLKDQALPILRSYLQDHENIRTVLASLGFDPFTDLHSVTVASPALSDPGKGLIVLDGRFQLAKFQAKAEQVAREQGEYLKIHHQDHQKVYEITARGLDNDRPLFVALLDEQTALAAWSRDELTAAFARAAGTQPSKIRPAVQEAVAQADRLQCIWITAHNLSGIAKDLPAEEQARKDLEKLHVLTGGLTVTDCVKLDLTLVGRSADDARDLSHELREGVTQAKALIELLAGSDPRLAPLGQVLDQIKVAATGNTVRVTGEVNGTLIGKLINAAGK